ncbi:MAG: phosphonate ABC transporter, permease protein PhnE [Sphingomonas sp.]
MSHASPARHKYPDTYSVRSVAAVMAALIVLAVIGHRVEIDRILTAPSLSPEGAYAFAGRFLPPQVEEREPLADAAPQRATWPSRIEHGRVPGEDFDQASGKIVRASAPQDFLVRPFGYATLVVIKMAETVEIALWGSVLAVLMGLPLALLSARVLLPNRIVSHGARLVVAMLRTMPELITALLLVAVYGFGPIAGVIALGLHGAGFLGKFFAEDFANADRKPRDALCAFGAGSLAAWRLAVLPAILPQAIASTLYILDRNVRMATVIGLVGAGGIGQELKGRLDLYEYHRVSTILIAIFAIVLMLDALSARIRRRLE